MGSRRFVDIRNRLLEFLIEGVLKMELDVQSTTNKRGFLRQYFANIRGFYQRYWRDIVIAVVIGAIAAIASYVLAQQVNSVIVEEKAWDVWFEADIPRTFQNMIDRHSDHYRAKVHPLFSISTFVPVSLLMNLFHLQPLIAVRVMTSLVAALWLAAIYALLRLISCRRVDAIIFSGLAATSAAALFWFAVPETYSFGSLTIALALCFVALTQRRQFSSLWYVLVSTMTLSMTTTNWMVGILATAANHRAKQAFQITLNALSLGVLLWAVQKFAFPTAQFFLGDREERDYIVPLSFNSLTSAGRSFFAHTMVMPDLIIDAHKYDPPHWPIMVTQPAIPGSGSLWGMVAVVSWMALFGLGVWGFFRDRENRKLRWVLGLTLLGQLVLHLIYGEETFLYALHFVPLLVVLAAFSTFTRVRPIALILAIVVLVTAAMNNYRVFQQATDFVQRQSMVGWLDSPVPLPPLPPRLPESEATHARTVTALSEQLSWSKGEATGTIAS